MLSVWQPGYRVTREARKKDGAQRWKERLLTFIAGCSLQKKYLVVFWLEKLKQTFWVWIFSFCLNSFLRASLPQRVLFVARKVARPKVPPCTYILSHNNASCAQSKINWVYPLEPLSFLSDLWDVGERGRESVKEEEAKKEKKETQS